MAVITCRKCGTTVKYEHKEPIECATCGAVYAKVEAAARDSGWQAPSAATRPAAATKPFIEELRAGTHYPAFRSVTNIFTWLLYLIAVAALILALVSRSGVAIAGALTGGALIVIVARVSKEAATMLADLSDAAIYTAQRQRQ